MLSTVFTQDILSKMRTSLTAFVQQKTRLERMFMDAKRDAGFEGALAQFEVCWASLCTRQPACLKKLLISRRYSTTAGTNVYLHAYNNAFLWSGVLTPHHKKCIAVSWFLFVCICIYVIHFFLRTCSSVLTFIMYVYTGQFMRCRHC